MSTMFPSNRQHRGARSFSHVTDTHNRRSDRSLYPEGVVPGGFTRYDYLVNGNRVQGLLDTTRWTRSRPTQGQQDFERLWDSSAYLGPSHESTSQTVYTPDTANVATPTNLPEPSPSPAAQYGFTKAEEEQEVPQPKNSIEAPAPVRPPRTLDLGLVFRAIVDLEEELKLLRECFDEFFGEAEHIGTIHLPY